ncbi:MULTISPECIES: hypothetical protein [unclassified Thiocapsa]|uniref:hypothetical protein n=1 Tax=unclassified Thiocapsa TaxID=2641286 RepID=UPI0035AFBD04
MILLASGWRADDIAVALLIDPGTVRTQYERDRASRSNLRRRFIKDFLVAVGAFDGLDARALSGAVLYDVESDKARRRQQSERALTADPR